MLGFEGGGAKPGSSMGREVGLEVNVRPRRRDVEHVSGDTVEDACLGRCWCSEVGPGSGTLQPAAGRVVRLGRRTVSQAVTGVLPVLRGGVGKRVEKEACAESRILTRESLCLRCVRASDLSMPPTWLTFLRGGWFRTHP